MKLQEAEIDRAVEELDASKQKEAYKITGSVMVSKPVAELKKELEEAKEAIGVRMKSLEKAESRVNEQLRELQERLKKFVK